MANEVQKRSFEGRIPMNRSLTEDYFILELILDSPKDTNSKSERKLCKVSGDQLPLTEYLGIVMNESGRKFLEREAPRKGISVENILWIVKFSNRRQLEKVKEVAVRELQNGYVWKVQIICNLCSSDNGDRKTLREPGSDSNTVWNAVATSVERGVRLDCEMNNLEAVVFDKLDI